jgi:translation initiation factor eIF-2B subunit epsilon
VSQTLERAFVDDHTADIATLELNTLKMAYNLSFRDLREIVVPGILELCIGKQNAQITKLIERWFPIVKKFVHTAEDEIDLLNVVVQFLLRNPMMNDQFPIILNDLFQNELLEEESTLKWYDNLRDAVGPLSKIRSAVFDFK